MGKSDLSGNEWTLEFTRRFLNEQRRRQQQSMGGGSGQSTAIDPITLAPWALYDPSDLTTLFQDSAMTIPVTTDGQRVGAMLDKSGNNNHLFQATANSRLTYRTSGGLRWVEGDGVDDTLISNVHVTKAIPIVRVGAYRYLGVQTTPNSSSFITNTNTSRLFLAVPIADLLRMSNSDASFLDATFDDAADFVSYEEFNDANSRLSVDNNSYVTGNTANFGIAPNQIYLLSREAIHFISARCYGAVVFTNLLDEGKIAGLKTYYGAKQGRVL